jgi:hypothetical protein
MRTTKDSSFYLSGNLMAAKAILEDPAKYPPESLPATWASRVLSRAVALPEDREAGPLFAQVVENKRDSIIL